MISTVFKVIILLSALFYFASALFYGMKKKFPTFLDETCQLYDEIAVSAGARGHQMIVPPEDLAQLVGAELVDITQ